jgi:hypothetical protein
VISRSGWLDGKRVRMRIEALRHRFCTTGKPMPKRAVAACSRPGRTRWAADPATHIGCSACLARSPHLRQPEWISWSHGPQRGKDQCLQIAMPAG